MVKSDLTTIYKAILETGWLITDENGEVYRNLGDVEENGEVKKEPFLLLEKKVALPTRENLNRSGRDNLLIFHPLMEGLIGGESPVIGKLRRAYGIRYAFCAISLYTSLLTAGGTTTEYAKFSPEQMRLFKALTDVDDKTVKLWERMVRLSIEKHGYSNAFVDVYINRNTVLGGQTYSRVASVRFPIYEELMREDGKIFGKDIAINKAQRRNFIALFEFMFPMLLLKEGYSKGSNARIAPYLDSLLGAFGELFKTTNNLYNEYHEVIIMDPKILAEIDWLSDFTQIESLKVIAQAVPQQYGNYAVKVEDEKRLTTGSTVQAAPPVVQRTIGADFTNPQKPVNQERLIVDTGPTKLAPAPAKFMGIGKPLSDANGVISETPVNLQATIITNNQSQAIIDPLKASVQATLQAVSQAHIGRVSAADIVHAPMQQMQNMQYGNQPLSPTQSGWANSPLNQQMQQQQQQNVAIPMMTRELALQKIMAPPQSYGGGSNGFFGGGSSL